MENNTKIHLSRFKMNGPRKKMKETNISRNNRGNKDTDTDREKIILDWNQMGVSMNIKWKNIFMRRTRKTNKRKNNYKRKKGFWSNRSNSISIRNIISKKGIIVKINGNQIMTQNNQMNITIDRSIYIQAFLLTKLIALLF